MQKKIIISGIKPTGMPHLGNYLGMIRLGLELAANPDYQTLYFIADYHALITTPKPQKLQQDIYEMAATWLALGLDPINAWLYRQSDIPEIAELAWVLSCVTKKGSMNMAHAYKAAVDQNQSKGARDTDVGVNMGLYNYPVLMAADVLIFNAHAVPVGKDQLQHIEIMRDIAGRFNHQYGQFFNLPQAITNPQTATLLGLDGRKMSKSYQNTIPLFAPPERLRKLIASIQTDSSLPGTPKDPNTSLLFEFYRSFATAEQVQAMQAQYAAGISWKEVKEALFTLLCNNLDEPRQRYQRLLNQPALVEEILQHSAQKARALAQPMLQQLRQAIGLAKSLH